MASNVVSRAAGIGALTAAGQIIIIGSLPMYSSVFDPGTYGEYLIFVGAVGVIGVFAGVRYDSAIVLPREDRIAIMLSALVMLIAVAIAALIAGATLLAQALAWAPDGWMRIERDFGYGLAAATVIGASQRCLSSWCIRGSRFFLMGLGIFLFSLVTVIAQLSLSRVTGQFPALIWGYVCALGSQTACLAAPNGKFQCRHWLRTVSLRGIGIVARKYRRFPTYMVGYALASSARDRLVQIMLGIGAGAAVVGRFGLAYRVAFAPNSLIYSAVSPIFFSIARRGNRELVGRLAAGLVEAAFVAMVVPYAAFAIEAPALTDTLLAAKWHGTGPYLQALAGPALLLAATCWLDRAFDSFKQQKVAFALEASFTVTSVALIACLSRIVGPITVAWAFGTLGILYYFTYFLAIFVACRFPLTEFRRVCATCLLALVVALSLGAAAHRIPGLQLRLAAYAALTTVVILGWIRFRDGAGVLRMLMRSRIGAHDASD